jgi:hypothetical protein
MTIKAASIAMKPAKVESITPPSGFTYAEESIARCCKMNGQNVPFLRSSSLRAFINVSGADLDFSIQQFVKELNIPVVRISL